MGLSIGVFLKTKLYPRQLIVAVLGMLIYVRIQSKKE
jgi:hypothetical protein